MWLKVALLTSFFVFLFFVSRLLELAFNGNELLTTHIFVHTIGFSVKQLKYLLDTRGISYDGVYERPELIRLVDDSGPVNERELIDSEQEIAGEANDNTNDIDSDANTNAEYVAKSDHLFSCGTHLYEEVEDTKDSAWIVNVMAVDGNNRIDPKLWTRIVQKCNKFGIRTAIFDCSLDPYLCQRKLWLSSRLILALPREGLRTKEDVLMMTYLIGKQTKVQQIFDWIHKQLATRVASIDSVDELQKNWLQSNSNKNSINTDVKLVFISNLATPPLILSALAIKFSGRIKFGFFRTDTEKKRSLIAKLDKRIPSYIMVMSDRHYNYGLKAGENLKYGSMELILRTLKPEMNDVFLVSLMLTNLSLGLHFFWMKCSKLWKHFIFWFMNAIKFNCILFLVWLTILASYNLPVMSRICTFGHYLCQHLALTSMATLLRYDMQYNCNSIPFLIFSFVTFGLLLAFVRRKLISSSTDDNDDHLLFRDWTPWESTLLSYILFRPISMTSFRSMANTSSIDHNLEEGMELLIERLAVPNLWLQPELISSDYIKELPVWNHQTNPQDMKESEVSDSDDSSVVGLEFKPEPKQHSSQQAMSPSTARSKLESPKMSKRCEHRSQEQNSSQKASGHELNHCSRSSRMGLNVCLRIVGQEKNSDNNCSKPGKPSKEEPNKPPEEQSEDQLTSNPNAIPDGMIGCSDCAICLEVYRNGASICGLPCGHNYHQNCIYNWLYRDNHCCPTCRWPTYKQKHKSV